MSDHLSPILLNSLADGELNHEQLANAQEHLAACSSCTTKALFQMMLKSATARAGHRHAPPPHLLERISRQAAQQGKEKAPRFPVIPRSASDSAPRSAQGFGGFGWAAAAALVLVSVGLTLLQRSAQQSATASAEHASLVTEVCDQHIAALAASTPPEVISSDRHTVKPWFQGKLPFSFNLPENLPSDTTLDGANLTYLGNQPVAQLLYRIGKHRVSIFLRGMAGRPRSKALPAEHSGFHVMAFRTDDLEAIAVSDVDPSRLASLVNALEGAQTVARNQAK